MFDVMNLLVSHAWAADAVAPAADAAATAVAAPGMESGLMRFMPLILILVVFYFLVIRPQQKKSEQTLKMLSQLKKGDKVITNTGMLGVVAKIEGDHHVLVEIAKGVEVKMLKSAIGELADDKTAANQNK